MFYFVVMVWVCEKVEYYQFVVMNQVLLLSYMVGSLLGLFFVVMLMQNYLDNLLFIMIVSVLFIYLLMLLCNVGQMFNFVVYI